MLAARADQENFVHEQQTAAAAKPLNQGLRGLTAKTPGNKAPKTPFKVPLNDENAQFRGGKSVLKTNGQGLDKTTGKKAPVFDKNAFVTPAGPRNRPALGVKTTNAKANVFKTPGNQKIEPSPLKTQKTGSPRLRRPKLKVLKPDVAEPESSDDDVDYEYMPPKEQPLAEHDSGDEFGPNKTFPHLAPENLMRGWASVYMAPLDENGLAPLEREAQERQKRFEKESDLQLRKAMDEAFAEIDRDVREDLGLAVPSSKKSVRANKKAPSTLLAKNAASALSRSSKAAPRLTTAAVSAAHKPRAPLALNVRKARLPPPAENNTTSQRNPAGMAASRSTLGYAQGRAVSQRVRKPVTSVFRDEAGIAKVTASRSVSDEDALSNARDVVSRLRMQDLSMLDMDEEEGLISNVDFEDDEYDDFQLPLPEGTEQ